jgi:hypothetical protein
MSMSLRSSSAFHWPNVDRRRSSSDSARTPWTKYVVPTSMFELNLLAIAQ